MEHNSSREEKDHRSGCIRCCWPTTRIECCADFKSLVPEHTPWHIRQCKFIECSLSRALFWRPAVDKWGCGVPGAFGNRHKQENDNIQDSIMAGKSSLSALWCCDSLAPDGKNEQRPSHSFTIEYWRKYAAHQWHATNSYSHSDAAGCAGYST